MNVADRLSMLIYLLAAVTLCMVPAWLYVIRIAKKFLREGRTLGSSVLFVLDMPTRPAAIPQHVAVALSMRHRIEISQSVNSLARETHATPRHFCSQHIFHVKSAGLSRLDRLETPSSPGTHFAPNTDCKTSCSARRTTNMIPTSQQQSECPADSVRQAQDSRPGQNGTS